MSNIDTLSVNAIRVLSADGVQKANSGHPGLPLGAAAMAYELWAKHMKHNPANPKWVNRDRFILSGGHGSMMLYSLLHLFGYGLTTEDLAQFRQDGSLTPGHPEYGHTVGVEATTGPLGAGMAMAVGMAMAEAHLASVFNKEGYPVVDHYTYVLGGDGCMMEGITYEAMSLAGTLGLGKLIVLYDSNKISIEGNTDIAFTEDVKKRFEAFGFQTLVVEDGNNLEEIGAAIEAAKADLSRPSLIIVKTKIGFGSPKEGMASAHGEPLGVENVKALRKNLGWPCENPFEVPEEVYEHYRSIAKKNAQAEEEWNKLFERYCKEYPEMKKLWDQYHDENAAKHLIDDEKFWAFDNKPDATRNISGQIINRIKDHLPNFIGGSADLAPSTKTLMKDAGDFSKDNYSGRNIHFGVRELAMAGIGNGMALHGGLKPFVSTFFVFSDYVKPMARLSALMEKPLIYVLTHDSIGVGEDGPTHEPIEQLAMLRAMPNFTVYRPADATECIAAWYYAITSTKTPTAIVLSRQNLPQLAGSSKEALKGAYIISDSEKEVPDAIIIATGSEVQLGLGAQEELRKEGIDVRVVSMPSMDVFEQQPEEYKEKVLPKNIRARVAVEALSYFGWGKYVGLDGAVVAMNSFGASAPADVLFKKFGFTVENVVKAVKSVL
ncbi:transketolase [Herbinix hemicellulosilytica]|uniref:Transketolase n=1 Tax=Herbinix hemicellulosilytica TaxID=1564487 RepID=A0A0H5SKS3_HERHM|nr:transketolase [Herbinix hemicellulosilytica]RBP57872.1 transketolase [Herbinix hemicellulosilytica]CRZ35720.1 Transketolase [Herbinix hemicellulosilytica]